MFADHIDAGRSDVPAMTADEVAAALDARTTRRTARGPRVGGAPIRIGVGDVTVEGLLDLPEGATAAVVFVDGPRSAPKDPGHGYVAAQLAQAGIGTLRVDLLTPEEDRHGTAAFDIDLLAGRLRTVTDWFAHRSGTGVCRIGYYGASTGAAAALRAAAGHGPPVSAIFSAGGWSDLAGADVGKVECPTCFVVGDWNQELLESNLRSQAHLTGISELDVVPGAGHRFEEPGMIEQVGALACDWFGEYLREDPAAAAGDDAHSAPCVVHPVDARLAASGV